MTAEPLKPCPFCNGNSRLWDDEENYFIACDRCGSCGATRESEAEAITAWNRREPFGNSEEFPPEWLIRRIKNVTYGYKPAGDGFGYRDGYYEALQWVLSLNKPEKE